VELAKKNKLRNRLREELLSEEQKIKQFENAYYSQEEPQT
jgi:hypothetical protein